MTKVPKNKGMMSVVKKYVKDEDLLDIPSRLFRSVLNRMDMNPIMWSKLLREYLEHAIVMNDKEKEKKARAHQLGNFKTAFFENNTLTFNKLIEGMSLLQFKKFKVTIECTTMDDEVITVTEESIIKNCKNSGDPVIKDSDN